MYIFRNSSGPAAGNRRGGLGQLGLIPCIAQDWQSATVEYALMKAIETCIAVYHEIFSRARASENESIGQT